MLINLYPYIGMINAYSNHRQLLKTLYWRVIVTTLPYSLNIIGVEFVDRVIC